MAAIQMQLSVGGSPGLEIVREDSCTRRCEFESKHQILDGHFSLLYKLYCLKRPNVKRKKAKNGHFSKNYQYCHTGGTENTSTEKVSVKNEDGSFRTKGQRRTKRSGQ